MLALAISAILLSRSLLSMIFNKMIDETLKRKILINKLYGNVAKKYSVFRLNIEAIIVEVCLFHQLNANVPYRILCISSM